MTKNLYLDIDSTVLDFNNQWRRWLATQGHDLPCLYSVARLAEMPGFDEEIERDLVHRFFDSAEAYDIPALKHASEALQSLYKRGWRFVAVTACPLSPGMEERRKANLEATMGVPFEAVHVSGFLGDKRDILSRFEPTVWVEDNYHNAQVGHDLGYLTFLIDYGHNIRADMPFIPVKSWAEISEHDLLKKLENN